MLSWLKKALLPTAATAAKQAGPATIAPDKGWIDVPRYPPFMKGLPVVEPEKLILSQQELLSQIVNSVLVRKDLYEKHYLGALRRFAAYAHLLPASQGHHHRGAGGLLRHSMEVGLWALQASDKMLLDVGKTPAQRRELEPRWQLAAFLGGLCHDAGKPATDLVVTSSDRTKVWKPITENLWDWADRTGVDAYFLDWRPGRSKSHIALSNLIAERIITSDTLGWIEEGGTELIVWLMETLNGSPSATNPLYDLVLKADQASVERDLKSMGVAMAGYEIGVPVERHLTDIMRRLIKQGIWSINEPGARVWNIEGNIYLVWPAAGDEMARMVKDDGVPGIPRTADGILDMLVERQLAFVNMDETYGRCWKIAPEVLAAKIPDIALSVIRLKDDALLSSSPIATVPGRVLGAKGAAEATTAAATPHTPQSAPDPAAQPVENAGAGAGAAPTPNVDIQAPVAPKPAEEPSAPKVQARESVATPSPQPAQKAAEPRAEAVPQQSAESPNEGAQKQKPKATKEQSRPVALQFDQARKERKSAPPTLVFDGATGEALKAIADDIKQGDKRMGVDAIPESDGRVCLRWPAAFSGYGLTPKVILDELAAKEWLWVDEMMPMRKVQEIEHEGEVIRVIRLELEASEAFMYAAQGGGKTARKAPAAVPGTQQAAQAEPDAAMSGRGEAPPPSSAQQPKGASAAPAGRPGAAEEGAKATGDRSEASQPKRERKNAPGPASSHHDASGQSGAVPPVSSPPAAVAPTVPAPAPRVENRPVQPQGAVNAPATGTAAPTSLAAQDQSPAPATVDIDAVINVLVRARIGEDATNPGWMTTFLQDARQALKKEGLQVDRARIHALAKENPERLGLAKGMLKYRA